MMQKLLAAGLLMMSCFAADGGCRFPFQRTRECRLTENGKARAAIVAPESLCSGAEKIAAEIFRITKVRVRVYLDREPEKLLNLSENLLIFGSRDENKLTSELYDRYFVILDRDYPGRDGWLIRSAPHPFSRDLGLLFAGGSDRAGTEKAIEELLVILRKTPLKNGVFTLPWLWELHPGKNFKAVPVHEAYNAPLWQEVNGYYGNQGYFGWNIISRLLALFYLTGDTAYAKEFLRLAFPDADALKYLKKPAITGESIELKERPLSGSYHYQAHLMVIYWNMVCDHPFFTPEIRTKIDKEFVRQYEYLSRKEANLEVTKVNKPMRALPDRHMTYSALCLYTLCRYLNTYAPCPEWLSGLRAADHVFASLKKRFWLIGEKGNHYWLPSCLQSVMDYLMFSGMQHRIPRRNLELLTHQMEVLASGRKNDPFLAFGGMAFFNQLYHLNGKKSTIAMRDSNEMDDRVFRLGRSFRPAEKISGRLPMNKWQSYFLDPAEIQAQKTDFPDKTASFALTSLRNDNGDFMLLDGRDEEGRCPKHIFSTIQLALNGAPLFSGYRSQLYSGSDGLIAPERRKFAELRKMETLGNTALFSARINNSNFITQERTWLKRTGAYALCVDTVTPERDAASLLLNFSWELDGHVFLEALQNGYADLLTTAVDKNTFLHKSQLSLSPAERIAKRRPKAPDTLAAIRPGDKMDVGFELKKPFEGYLLAYLLRSGGAAWVNVALNGKRAAGPLKRITQEFGNEPIWLGPYKLPAGKHTLSLISAGEARHGSGQMLGIYGIRLVEKNSAEKYRLGFSASTEIRRKDAIDDTMNGGSGHLLEFRSSVPAVKGEKQFYFTLLAPQKGQSRNCIALAGNAALLYLPEKAVAVSGEYENIRGKTVVLAGSHVSGYAVSQVRELLSSTRPINIEWDFSTGKLELVCSAEVTLCFADGSSQTLTAGRHKLTRNPDRTTLEKLTAWLADLHVEKNENYESNDLRKTFLPEKKISPVWQRKIAEYPAEQQIFYFKDRQALFTAVGKKVKILDAATGGELLTWKEDADVTALCAVPGANLLIIGRMDCLVKGYDLTGKRLWQFQSEMHPEVTATGKAYWFRSYPGLGGIRKIADAPFDGNRHKLFIGTASTVEILNMDGTLDKRIRQWWGPCCQFTPLRRKNGENVMLVGRRHNGFHHLGILEASNPRFDCKGFWDLKNPKHFVLGWIGVVRGHIFVEDLEGSGEPVVISDLTGVDNRIAIWDANGKPLRDVPLFGANDAPMRATDKPSSAPMPLRDMGIGSLNGGQKQHIYCVTEESLLLEFDPKLKLKRSTRLPVEPLLLELLPGQNRLAVAGRNGEIILLDGNGKTLSMGKISGTPLWINRAGNLVIVASNREIAAFSVR